jgi:hypothetical protein
MKKYLVPALLSTLLSACVGGDGTTNSDQKAPTDRTYSTSYTFSTDTASGGYMYTGNNQIYPICNFSSLQESCTAMTNTALMLQNGQWQSITWAINGDVLANSNLKCSTTYNSYVACANGSNVVVNNPSNGNITNIYNFSGDYEINKNIGYFTQNYYYTATSQNLWACSLSTEVCTSILSFTTNMGSVSWGYANGNIYAYMLTDVGQNESSPMGYYDLVAINSSNNQATIYRTPYSAVGVSSGLAIDPNNTTHFFVGGVQSVQSCNLDANSFNCQSYVSFPSNLGLQITALGINNGSLYIPAVDFSTGNAIMKILSVATN